MLLLVSAVLPPLFAQVGRHAGVVGRNNLQLKAVRHQERNRQPEIDNKQEYRIDL